MRPLRTPRICASLVGLALLGVGAHARQDEPEFAAEGSDGHLHTIGALSRHRTLVLYFVKHDCSMLKSSFPFYNAIASMAQGSDKLLFYGVINGTTYDFRSWSKKFKPLFPFLLDYERRLVSLQGVKNSSEVLIVKDGKVTERFKAFSKRNLEAIASIVAKGTGKKVEIDVSSAPLAEKFGCHY